MSAGKTERAVFWDWSIDGEADAIFAKAAAEHDQKQKANEAWGLLDYERWDLELTVGELRFVLCDGRIATAPVQVVGSFDLSDQTWQWSWDNPSINRLLSQDARLCRDFGERHKLPATPSPCFNARKKTLAGSLPWRCISQGRREASDRQGGLFPSLSSSAP